MRKESQIMACQFQKAKSVELWKSNNGLPISKSKIGGMFSFDIYMHGEKCGGFLDAA